MAFGMLGPVGAGTKNSGGGWRACGTNGNITWSPNTLWPPNHKAVPLAFVYTDNDPGTKELTILSNAARPHNEVTEGEEINGTGNTPFATDATVGPPATGSTSSVTVTGTAVAERSGHKKDADNDGRADGRVYEFDYIAENVQSGGTDGCESDTAVDGDGLLVSVPHDCRAAACRPQPVADGS